MLAAVGIEGVLGSLFAALMLAIAIVDAREYLIPNKLTAAAFVLALVDSGFVGPAAGYPAVELALFRSAATSAFFLVLMLAYRKLRSRDGLGFGDVKLAGVAGAWLDWTMIAIVVEVAALSALAVYVLRSYRSGRSMRVDEAMPFGLFLAPSIWLGWLLQFQLS